jgi:hypothetical protein
LPLKSLCVVIAYFIKHNITEAISQLKTPI